ncbi:hypothetical protein [Sediminicoccus sp. KRV36]|uniref:hypothetical protein n=1 Tax=Sediminicoccus sp. KRV36 TaxID=3133721 RepID=UPI00200C0B4C|nr:hypothetical protein [Sediminicoccus rosea]UPY37025.1 hypothetical protein LHU95_22880 [Sediminicoccus rosea]
MANDGFSIADAGDDPPADGDAPKRNRRDKLALLLSDVDLWRSPDGVAHASVPMGRHREHMRVQSRDCRTFLLTAFYGAHGAGLSGTALGETINLAEARALSSGDVKLPWRRFAQHEGDIWIDLGGGDPEGERRAVRITGEGWRIIAPAEVTPCFLRAPDSLPLPCPEPDGAKPADLAQFVNADEDGLALIWAWLLCAARPFAEGGSYPIALLHGEQGSGKSGASRALQSLIDPSTLTGRALPREERDLFISAANRHLLAFDNLSGLGDAFADCFCRIATGGGFSARALHTDGDESIFTAVRPLLFNGIPSTILARPDLADRALSIELRPLAQRREEAAIRGDFQRLQPGLLGLICDGLAAALRNIAGMKIADPPRMMDAALWAEAAAPGLGLAPGVIATAWRANRHQADRAALEVDDVAQALVALLNEQREKEGRDEWRGGPTELFTRLSSLVPERVSRSPLWPKTANVLGTKLKRIAPGMRAVHRIDFIAGKGGADGARWWHVRRL